MSCVSIHEMLKMCASTFVKIVLLRHSICKRRWNERGNGLHNNNRTRKEEEKNLHGSKIRFSVCLLFDIIWMHGYLTCLQLQQKEKNYDDKQRRKKKYEVLRGHDGEIRKYTPWYLFCHWNFLFFGFHPRVAVAFFKRKRDLKRELYNRKHTSHTVYMRARTKQSQSAERKRHRDEGQGG